MKRYYSRILFLAGFFSVFFTLNLKAQTDSVKAAKLKAQLIDTICTCISQSDTSAVKTADDAQGLLMKCFMGNGMGIFMDYATATGVDFSNGNAMQEMAKKIGMELSVKCPALMKLAMKIASNSGEMKKLMDEYNKPGAPPADNKSGAPDQKN